MQSVTILSIFCFNVYAIYQSLSYLAASLPKLTKSNYLKTITGLYHETYLILSANKIPENVKKTVDQGYLHPKLVFIEVDNSCLRVLKKYDNI